MQGYKVQIWLIDTLEIYNALVGIIVILHLLIHH